MSKFKHECIVRLNEESIRERLRDLGYYEFPLFDPEADWLSTCIHDSDEFYIDFCEGEMDPDETIEDYGIDCGTNVELFLAIAAMSDESDYMQYFILDCNMASMEDHKIYPKGSIVKCTEDEWNELYPAHKATVEELINYFNHEN